MADTMLHIKGTATPEEFGQAVMQMYNFNSLEETEAFMEGLEQEEFVRVMIKVSIEMGLIEEVGVLQ